MLRQALESHSYRLASYEPWAYLEAPNISLSPPLCHCCNEQ
jgi:hypothetical protein